MDRSVHVAPKRSAFVQPTLKIDRVAQDVRNTFCKDVAFLADKKVAECSDPVGSACCENTKESTYLVHVGH
jgi:hypothetical protein